MCSDFKESSMPREREEEVWETTGRWDGSEAVVPPRPRMRRLDFA